jgi:spore germination protein YaaH
MPVPLLTANKSLKYDNPFITFKSDEDETVNIVWYENKQSIEAKLKLAFLMGVHGISFCRISLFPDDFANSFAK